MPAASGARPVLQRASPMLITGIRSSQSSDTCLSATFARKSLGSAAQSAVDKKHVKSCSSRPIAIRRCVSEGPSGHPGHSTVVAFLSPPGFFPVIASPRPRIHRCKSLNARGFAARSDALRGTCVRNRRTKRSVPRTMRYWPLSTPEISCATAANAQSARARHDYSPGIARCATPLVLPCNFPISISSKMKCHLPAKSYLK